MFMTPIDCCDCNLKESIGKRRRKGKVHFSSMKKIIECVFFMKKDFEVRVSENE